MKPRTAVAAPSGHILMKNRGQPALIWQLTRRGFCSEINVMVLGVLFSLLHDMDFMLCSKYWSSAYHHGWRDYFDPFCEELASPLLRPAMIFDTTTACRRYLSWAQKAALAGSLGRGFCLTRDVWEKIWDRKFIEQRFDIESWGIHGDSYTACQIILRAIWRFNERMQRVAMDAQSRLSVNTEPYFAIHIRRGDKRNEAPIHDLSRYINAVHDINRHVTNAFVMTDDFSSVLELRDRCPDWNIETMCSQQNAGHDQRSFNSLASESRRVETERFLVELTIAQGSLFFVGTATSNVARLMCLLKDKESVYCIDQDYHMMGGSV